MFGAFFKGTGGAILAVGLIALALAAVAAGIAFTDEQDNQGQDRGCFGFCGGPDEGRSEMNFGAMEAAMSVGALGLVGTVVGIIILAMGGGVSRMEEHERRMEEAKAGRGP